MGSKAKDELEEQSIDDDSASKKDKSKKKSKKSKKDKSVDDESSFNGKKDDKKLKKSKSKHKLVSEFDFLDGSSEHLASKQQEDSILSATAFSADIGAAMEAAEGHGLAIKALAILRVCGFDSAKEVAKEIKARCGAVDDNALKAAERAIRAEQLKASKKKNLGSLDLVDSVHDCRPQTSKANSTSTNSTRESTISEDVETSDLDDSSSAFSDDDSSDKKGVGRKVSFGRVSTDEFEAISPKKKSALYYSKDEISQFKSEDQAEKEADREKKAAVKKAEKEKREAMTEAEIRKAHSKQLADQKRKLKEDSERREEEWKKQQAQAEAMEQMMKASLSAAYSHNLWSMDDAKSILLFWKCAKRLGVSWYSVY